MSFSGGTILLSSIICFFSYTQEDPNLAMLAVFTPTLTAFFLTLVIGGRKGLKALFVHPWKKRISLRWVLLSVFGIPFFVLLAILTSLGFDVSQFGWRTTQLLPQLTIIFLISLGEEFGWRGYLQPLLMTKFSVFHSSLILGFVWGIWHYPAYLIGTGVPLDMDFQVFLLWVVLASLFMGWIYSVTRNVLTAILIHSSANAAFNYLPILPEFTQNMDRFWYLILYLAIFLAIVYFHGRKKWILTGPSISGNQIGSF